MKDFVNKLQKLKACVEQASLQATIENQATAIKARDIEIAELKAQVNALRDALENQKLDLLVSELEAQLNGLENELNNLKTQGHFFAVTYRDNLMYVSISQEEANNYSDKFGSVYSVKKVYMEDAFEGLNND